MLHKTAELETRTIANKLVENNHFRTVIVNICRTNWFPTPKTKKCFLYPRRSEVQESSAILPPLDGFPSSPLRPTTKQRYNVQSQLTKRYILVIKLTSFFVLCICSLFAYRELL